MNKGQRMKVRQRGRGNTSSGVAPQDMIFIPVPASYLPWQDFFIFSGGFRYVLVHKALAQARRCKFYSQRKQKLI